MIVKFYYPLNLVKWKITHKLNFHPIGMNFLCKSKFWLLVDWQITRKYCTSAIFTLRHLKIIESWSSGVLTAPRIRSTFLVIVPRTLSSRITFNRFTYSQGSVRSIRVPLVRKRQALSDSASFVACEQRNRNLIHTVRAFRLSLTLGRKSHGTVLPADLKTKRCNATFLLSFFSRARSSP